MSIHRAAQSLSASAVRPDKLENLVIRYEADVAGQYTQTLRALFNPTKLDYQRDVRWKVTNTVGGDAASPRYVFEFQSSQPRMLTLELFFDTSESAPPSSRFAATDVLAFDDSTPAPPGGTDVTGHTDGLLALTRVVPKLGRPPCCELWWGRSLVLTGVLRQLGQSFTWFLPNGTPVRASVSCSFQEVPPDSQIGRQEKQPADAEKRRVVRSGDTLQSIAAEEYADPTRWRSLARANGIEDPRRLMPGKVLIIPRSSK
jgi:hypothetical protein